MDTKQNMEQKRRRLLVFEVDDVVLNSSETIVEIVNKKYDLSPQIKFEDVKDLDFIYLKKEIKRQRNINLYTQDFLKLFETEEFWEKVSVRKDFLDILYNPIIREHFMFRLVSSGTEKNLKLKEKFLRTCLNMEDIRFIGLPLDKNKKNLKYGKRALDKILPMWGGIQIDDNYEYLHTNAELKILLKNNKETSYNQVLDTREDLYIVNDLKEIKDILLFIINANNEFFKDFKFPFFV